MILNRRAFLQSALSFPAAAWLANYRALASPVSKMVKITAIKTMGLDNVGDGCLVKIETDAGISGYGEAGLPSGAAREETDLIPVQVRTPAVVERQDSVAVFRLTLAPCPQGVETLEGQVFPESYGVM